MRFERHIPAREFQCGLNNWITLKDCGDVELDRGEEVVFVTDIGRRFNVLRRDWGYFVNVVLDGGAAAAGWRSVIAGESHHKQHLILIEPGRESDYAEYCARDRLQVFVRFDNDPPGPPGTAADDVWPVSSKRHELLLAPDEQVTFVTPSGTQYDVTRKSWGFYATPSFGWRLARFNLRPALTRLASNGARYLALVERGHESAFADELGTWRAQVASWLDAEPAGTGATALDACPSA